MRALLSSDLHFVDSPTCAYRWAIFDWLKELADKKKCEAVVLLGDLTDFKDNHSSDLVNKITLGLRKLAEGRRVYILKGNHDYIEQSRPFFEFVSGFPRVSFITKPTLCGSGGETYLFLPHSKTPEKDLELYQHPTPTVLFMHQTVSGAKASNGCSMVGLRTKSLRRFKLVISGDVHVPQKVGPVTYVGSPYHVHFGDSFKPRVLIVDGAKMIYSISRRFPTRSHLKIHSFEELETLVETPDSEFREGDQVKVTVVLKEQALEDWFSIKSESKRLLESKGVYLAAIKLEKEKERVRLANKDIVAVSPKRSFVKYCKVNKVNKQLKQVGLDLLEEEE